MRLALCRFVLTKPPLAPLCFHRNMTSKPPFRERAVVSSFIFTSQSNASNQEFALFKRSQKVRTYPGKWAVCSGSIEPTDTDALSAAQREITEETALSLADFSLLTKGKPFSLTDDELKTRWTIHPFAWKLKRGSEPIKIDWEHTEYRFVKPDEIGTFDHVPQLEIGMNRVLLSKETDNDLSVLHSAQYTAATQLIGAIFNLLRKSISTGDLRRVSTSTDLWRALRWKLWHLVENSGMNAEVIVESEVLLGSLLDQVMKGLECRSAYEIEIKDVVLLRDVISDAISLDAEKDWETTLKKGNSRNQDCDKAWENMMEDL